MNNHEISLLIRMRSEADEALRSFGGAVRQAEGEARKLGTAVDRLGGATRQTKSFVDEIDATTTRFTRDQEKATRAASVYAQAVAELGGASRLTATQQREVASAVEKATAAYAAQGREVPAHVRALGTELQVGATKGGAFNTSLSSIASTVGRFVAVGAVVTAARQTFDLGSAIQAGADRAGMAVEPYQKLTNAAKGFGVTADQLTGVIATMADRVGSGDKSAVGAFTALGLNVDALKQQKPDEIFLALAGAIGRIQDPLERARLTQDAFGDSGLQVGQLLNDKYVEAARSAAAMSEESVRALDDTSKALTRAKDAGQSFLGTVLTPMVPALEAVARGAEQAANRLGDLSTRTTGGTAMLALGRAYGLSPEVMATLFPQDLLDSARGKDRPALPTAPGLALPTAATAAGLSDDMVALAVRELTVQAQETTRTQKALAEASADAAQALWRQAQWAAKIANQTNWLGMMPGGNWQPFSLTMDGTKPPSLQLEYAELVSRALPWSGMAAPLFDPRTGANLLGPSPNPLGTSPAAGFSWGGFGAQTFNSLAPMLMGVIGSRGGQGSAVGGTIGGLGASLGVSLAGTAIGSTLGSILPGIGTIVGGLIGGLFGPSKGAVEGKRADASIADLQSGLLQQFGSLDAIRELGAKVGVDLAGAWGDKNVAGLAHFKQLTEEFTAKLSALNELTAQQKDLEGQIADLREAAAPTWQKMQAAAERFGVDVAALGPAFAQLKLNDQAADLASAFQTMTDGIEGVGGDVGGILFGMREEFSALVRDSLKFGTAIPANLEPMIAELWRSGNLLDENGEKLETIAGIRFGAPVKTEAELMRSALDTLIEKLQIIIDRIAGLPGAAGTAAGGVEGALNNIQIEPIRVPIEFDDGGGYRGEGSTIDIPGAANGILASRPTLRVFAEREPELGGSVSFMSKALAGALQRSGGFVAGAASHMRELVIRVGEREFGRIAFDALAPELQARGIVRR